MHPATERPGARTPALSGRRLQAPLFALLAFHHGRRTLRASGYAASSPDEPDLHSLRSLSPAELVSTAALRVDAPARSDRP